MLRHAPWRYETALAVVMPQLTAEILIATML